MKIGFQISSLAPVLVSREALLEALLKLRRMGYDCAQIQWIAPEVTPEEIAEAFSKAGMAALGTQEKYDALVGRMDYFLAVNRLCGSRDVCFSGIPARFEGEAGIESYISEMRGHMRALEKAGLRASYHPVKDDFRLIAGAPACEILLEEIQDLRVVPDTNQLIRAGVNISEWLVKYKGRMDMIHFKDMTDPSEQAKLTPVGKGMTDFSALLPAICEAGIEYLLCEQEKWEGDPFECMRESYSYMRSLL